MSNFANIDSSGPKVMLLSEVVVPSKFYDRINITEHIDVMFGGDHMPGILPGSITLVTGQPGAGKSTMMLQIADILAINGKSVLYNIGEENEKMVKIAANRLGLKGNFVISKFIDIDELHEFASTHKVDILIQDSLQSLRTEGLDGPKLLRYCAEKLVQLSKESDVTVFLVGHITKGGDFAGPKTIQHDVDAHAHLSYDKKTGSRYFQLNKNRFGPAMVPFEIVMTSSGLEFRKPSDDSDDSSDDDSDDDTSDNHTTDDDNSVGDAFNHGRGHVSRASDRRQQALDLVKNLLLSGRKLSGYSHEEEPELSRLGWTGGFMRAILRLATIELQRDGKKINTTTINRREHVFVKV